LVVLSRGGECDDYDFEIFELLGREIPVFVFVYAATIVRIMVSFQVQAVLTIRQLYNLIEQFRTVKTIKLDDPLYAMIFPSMMNAGYEKDVGFAGRRQDVSDMVSSYLDIQR
jgi:hypothetical protein